MDIIWQPRRDDHQDEHKRDTENRFSFFLFLCVSHIWYDDNARWRIIISCSYVCVGDTFYRFICVWVWLVGFCAYSFIWIAVLANEHTSDRRGVFSVSNDANNEDRPIASGFVYMLTHTRTQVGAGRRGGMWRYMNRGWKPIPVLSYMTRLKNAVNLSDRNSLSIYMMQFCAIAWL